MSEPSLDLRRYRIMLIEDEVAIRQMVVAFLQRLGVRRVFEFDWAETALTALRKHPGRVDLILLDLGLPGLDGLDFMKRLRNIKHPHTQKLPVVVITGHNDMDMYQKISHYGVSKYLLKPISPGLLGETIRGALRLAQKPITHKKKDAVEAFILSIFGVNQKSDDESPPTDEQTEEPQAKRRRTSA